MSEDSTFTLDLLPGQIHGNDLIEISQIISEQNLKLTGYSITCTNQNTLLGGLYIESQELVNVGHLMDNNSSLNSLTLETTDNTTQTFVSDCYKIWKLSRDLDHSFYVRCYYKNATGVFIPITATNFADIRVRIIFVLQTV